MASARLNPKRIRVEQDPVTGDWTVTDYNGFGATELFRGSHEDAVKFAAEQVKG